MNMSHMKKRIVKSREGRMEEIIDVPVNLSVRTTAFEPLEARIAREKPELLAGLKALKKIGSIINVGVLWTLLFTRPLVLR